MDGNRSNGAALPPLRRLAGSLPGTLSRTAVIALSTGVAIATPPTLRAEQSTSRREYEVKAAFLYNFGKFVEWPHAPTDLTGSLMTLCIVGKDPFGKILDRMLSGKKLHGKTLTIKRSRLREDLQSCRIVFISSSETKHLSDILESLRGLPVLSVGETPGFARLGGIINFTVVNKKVRFDINGGAARRAGLRISSRLLNLARVVMDDTHRKGNQDVIS